MIACILLSKPNAPYIYGHSGISIVDPSIYVETLRLAHHAPFLSARFFFQILQFSRLVNFVSRYGGILSQFVNLNSPGKIANY